ncbi:hypothetical protein F8M41_006029 [Gigaspora margarita]|uniref:Uncharacterized protein n=1 Tax=Gigaspora margarita TaxID=4874 RepID=A0A8H4AWY5_GIGMA|nr:hypothetical protein F8M41_006029 [Gigaspora margarita]
MSDFKCNFCSCTFTKRNTLSKLINVCVLTAGEDVQLFANIPAQVRKFSNPNIKFRKTLKVVKDIQFNSNSNFDSTLASPLHVSNTDKLASSFDNISSSDEEFDQKHEEFSNEAYTDLMVLVTKYKLSNAAENAIISFFNKYSKHSTSPLPKNIRQEKEFMNNIKSNLSYKKTKILDLDDTEYFLYHMPLISCIENILKIPDIAQNLEFEYKELYKSTEIYIIFNIICKYNIYFVFINLFLIFLKDGKEIIYKEQNNGIWWKTAQNSLPIGSKLLSIILYSDATNCDTLVRQTFHRCLEVILNPIQKFLHSGTNLLINNKLIWTFPKVSIIIADWPEAAKFCLTYKSTNSNHPCHFCLVNRVDLANTTHSKHDLVLRNHENIDMNIYEVIVIDRMHYLDLGLFKHQINFTCSLLKEKYGASILDTIDNRLANISRFLELKIFKNGIQSLARITANEYRNLIKNLIINWAQQFIKLFKTSSTSKLKFPKLHSWVYHTTDLIKKYGCLNGFSTETYKSLHKDFVKTLYYLSNKQNIEDQIMKMVQRQAIASKLLSRNPKNSKIINPFKFTNLIWTFDLNNTQEFIDQRLKNYRPNSKIYSGLEHLLKYLTIYFSSTNQINIDNYIINIYSSVTLKNGSIIRATDNFYGKAWYSNVAVAMNPEELLEYLTDEGICYGQIYLLIKVETAKGNVDNLALIWWYDFKSTKN